MTRSAPFLVIRVVGFSEPPSPWLASAFPKEQVAGSQEKENRPIEKYHAEV